MWHKNDPIFVKLMLIYLSNFRGQICIKLACLKKGAMTFRIMKLSITAFSIMTLSIKGVFATPSINDTQHSGTQYRALLCWVSLCWLLHFIYCLAKTPNPHHLCIWALGTKVFYVLPMTLVKTFIEFKPERRHWGSRKTAGWLSGLAFRTGANVINLFQPSMKLRQKSVTCRPNLKAKSNICK